MITELLDLQSLGEPCGSGVHMESLVASLKEAVRSILFTVLADAGISGKQTARGTQLVRQ